MEKVNEIKLPKGVDSISVTQHDDKIVIEFIPEKPKFKRGDILKSTITPKLTVIFDKTTSTTAFDSIYNNGEASNHYWGLDSFRHATKEEKQEFFDELEVKGKRWNDDKKCIEDIPVYNHGDFLVSKGGYPFILDREGRNGKSHYLFAISIYDPDVKSIQDSGGELYCGYLKDASVADQETIKKIHDGLKSIGKRWNADKKCIEDIPKRKFKAGDKVTLKSRCISKTDLEYLPFFDKYIGERLDVVSYTESGNVQCNNYFIFHEDWLEPCSEEPKKGDWAIFWDNYPLNPLIRLYHAKSHSGNSYIDNFGTAWDNAVKWDGTKEQFEKILRGEI
jgi:hypothetical protein